MQDGETSDLARAGLVVAGKFRLDACIGQGGMGSVWSATHLGLGNQIAIKLISREFARSPDALRRFDAEAKAAARLQSRHVVQVYDHGTLEDGSPYIAMELLSGESLQQRIDRTGALPLDETVHILAQCCKALGRAHAFGIVHRDIKPDNIFLARSPDEDGYIVKILDFGVAKMAVGGGDQSTTKTGAVLGTPLYMSPEQARGQRNIDHRSDLYSLGVVAYTMITGRIAFSGESFGEILLKICAEPLPSLQAAANVPASLDRWFQRVCARDPEHRCASAQEFVESLRTATGMFGSSSPGTGAPAGAASGMGSAGVARTQADTGSEWRLPPAAPAQSLAEANVSISAAGLPRRPRGLALAAVAAVAGLAVGAAAFLAMPRRGGAPSGDSSHATAAASATPAPPSAVLAPAPPTPPITTLAPPSAGPSSSASPMPPPRHAPAVEAARSHDAPAPARQTGPAPHPGPSTTKAPAVDLGY